MSRLLLSSKERVVVIMGATGTGKSKLSIDLSLLLSPPAEIINSDKIQVYSGLDLTTNKVSPSDLSLIRHHLLGTLNPAAGELSAAGFRSLARAAIADISSRRQIPIIAGGSVSFTRAVLQGDDVRGGGFDYEACVIWVHVDRRVLEESLEKRVEEMVGRGMVAELAAAYEPLRRRTGYVALWRAIGVPEFDRYFERFPPGKGGGGAAREAAEMAAVAAVKESTQRLAAEQVEKIRRLAAAGWKMTRVDATAAVAAALRREKIAAEGREGATARREKITAEERREKVVEQRREEIAAEGRREKDEAEEVWKREVVGPSLAAVEEFLERESGDVIEREREEFLERERRAGFLEREREEREAAEGIGRLRLGEISG